MAHGGAASFLIIRLEPAGAAVFATVACRLQQPLETRPREVEHAACPHRAPPNGEKNK